MSRGGQDVTGSVAARAPSPGELSAQAETWGPRYERNKSDRTAALAYGRALRGLGQTDQSVAVLQNAAIAHPDDREVLGQLGRALADARRFDQAAQVLANAHSPDRPDWRIYNVQGAVADEMNDHAAAQAFYDAALKIAPGDPAVLSNLGLSLALSRRLPEAEQTLRQAAQTDRSTGRARANLAIVLALEGKFTEAEDVAKRDLPPEEAAANVAAMRAMLSQQNSWKAIKDADRTKKPKPTAQAAKTSAPSGSGTSAPPESLPPV